VLKAELVYFVKVKFGWLKLYRGIVEITRVVFFIIWTFDNSCYKFSIDSIKGLISAGAELLLDGAFEGIAG
jgi:hypothetical protein